LAGEERQQRAPNTYFLEQGVGCRWQDQTTIDFDRLVAMSLGDLKRNLRRVGPGR
jgi:hypothetical protein